MQLENINKSQNEDIPEDSHLLHLWEPCKFEINDNFKFVNDNFLFNLCSNLLYLIAYPILIIINKFFFGFKTKGKENLMKVDGGKITVSNHVHPMDCTMIAISNIPSKTFFTSLETNFKIPVIRKIIKLLNAIPIPKDIQYTKKFMNSIDDLLNSGKTIHFYPEGSLWPYCNKIRHFKNGAFDFAVRNNVPIVPMVFKFTKEKHIFTLLKSKPSISLEILEPIYPNIFINKKEAIIDLKKKVYNSMNNIL